jgi:hypothetical protein
MKPSCQIRHESREHIVHVATSPGSAPEGSDPNPYRAQAPADCSLLVNGSQYFVTQLSISVILGRQPNNQETLSMWPGFDPEFVRQLGTIRQMVSLRSRSPTREWPLIFVEDRDELLVVREWPDGSVTAFMTSEYSSDIRKNRS